MKVHSLLIHELVEEAVYSYAHQSAIIHKAETPTFSTLSKRADELAQAIIHQFPQDDIIGVSTTRSTSMVVSVLAILKAGKAYIPLDPTYPTLRLEQIISDSTMRVCLTDAADEACFAGLGLNVIRADLDYAFEPLPVLRRNSTACILYTSGSTGKPKGVCLGQAGLVNLLQWQQEHAVSGPNLQTLQFCHLSFDASLQEIFLPLVTSGAIHLIDDSYRLDAGRLLNYVYLIEQEGKLFSKHMIIQNPLERLFPALITDSVATLALIPVTPDASSAGKDLLYPLAVVMLGSLLSSKLLYITVRPIVFHWFVERALETHIKNKNQGQFNTADESAF